MPLKADPVSPSMSDHGGYAAILLWSFSALFIGWTAEIPPFLTACLTSGVGFAIFALQWLAAPRKFGTALRQDRRVWGLFFLSIVVYRGFYLAGLKYAPIVESNLLNYLWPFFIVALSAFQGRTRLRPLLLIGVLCCFSGVLMIGFDKGLAAFSFRAGHVFALLGAMTWAVYSVLTRRFPSASMETMGIMHFLAVGIFGGLHLACEAPVGLAAISPQAWLGVVGWGASLSVAYKLWDKAMSCGSREKIAAAAYWTPLLSTFWLILLGKGAMTAGVLAAAVLIIGGSAMVRLADRR